MPFKPLLAAALLFLVPAPGALGFELKSPDLAPGGKIAEKFVFNGFGCSGGGLSPALNWSDPPPGARSFAVTVHDPDAPTGGAGFWHWIVFDIPASATGLPQGVGKDGKGLPEGARQAQNDFGAPGYGGPCPPKGDKPHHYHFTVYALKVDKLDLPPHGSASLAGSFINAHSLGKASLTGTYGR